MPLEVTMSDHNAHAPNAHAPTIATAEAPAPCPWCGCTDHELHTREFIDTGEDGSVSIVRHVAVVCELCRARGAFGISRYDAVSYWNRVAGAFPSHTGPADAPEEHMLEQATLERLPERADTARGGQ